MATTNLHLATNLDRTPLRVEQIKLGLRINYPSGRGGVFTGACKRLSEDSAEFVSIDPNWPSTFVVRFNQPDLTDDELGQVRDFFKRGTSWYFQLTPEESELLVRATELGYVSSMSQTQKALTEKAINRLKESQAA